MDKAWGRLLTIEETYLRTPISQFLDRIKEETRWREEAVMREVRGPWLALEERLLGLKEMYCVYCILDPYNANADINRSLQRCKRASGDKEMSRLRQAVPDELPALKLPPPGCGCFRCLMPKNICAKQQEANGLAGGRVFHEKFPAAHDCGAVTVPEDRRTGPNGGRTVERICE